MARELHEEPRSPQGNREDYVWNSRDALKYFFMFRYLIISL